MELKIKWKIKLKTSWKKFKQIRNEFENTIENEKIKLKIKNKENWK